MVQAMSQSMAPMFEPGNCRHARYLNGEYERLQHGDVVLFLHPINNWEYLDRVIALGGETLQMIDGVIWLNGDPLPQVKIEDYEVPFERTGPSNFLPMCQNSPKFGEICRTEQFVETAANGRSYQVLNVRVSRSDNTEVFTIPDGFVFVMGDHRDNSIDSRFAQTGPIEGIGLVPLENIIGIVEDD